MVQSDDISQKLRRNTYSTLDELSQTGLGKQVVARAEQIKRFDERELISILFAISLALNLTFITVRQNFYSPSTWENGRIAQHLINGLGFSLSQFGDQLEPTSIMAPIYPHFLAGVYTLFGISPTSHIAIQLIHAIVQAGAVVAVFYIARELFDVAVGAVSALMFAAFPDYLYGVTVIHSLTFVTLSIAVLLWSLLRVRSDPSMRNAMLAGAILGGTALLLPTVLFFSPFIGLWLFIELGTRTTWQRATPIVASLTLVTIAFVIPWTTRNYLVHDQFVLLKQTGYNFWRGNVPPAIHEGGANTLGTLSDAAAQKLATLGEAEGNDFLQQRAIAYITAHPVAFIEAFGRRMVNFWWFPPVMSDSQNQTTLLRKIAYTPVLLSGIGGLILSRQRWRELVPIYLLFAAFTIGYAVFFIRPRYRTPTTQPYLIVFSACFVCYIVRKAIRDYRGYYEQR